MVAHSKSWKLGFDAGFAWFNKESNKGFAEQLLGFGIEKEPRRSGDHEYNQGVRDGIAEARRARG